LQSVIMRALEKDPTVRYQTMLEFAQAISASTDAASLGYRPSVSTPSEHPALVGAHAPGTPTQAQFSANTPSPKAASQGPGRARDTDAARAETLIGAEASARAPAARSKAGLVAALVLLVGLAGGGAWFLTHRTAGTNTSPTPETPSALAAVALASTASALPALSAAPVASAQAAVAPAVGIHLAVATEPSGAILLKNGFQVCDQTPCDVLAAPAETVEFQAVKGPLKGTAKVLAQRDQKVTIKLLGAVVSAAPKPAAGRLCEVEVDGLKILRACK
jgi:hypothetical protein